MVHFSGLNLCSVAMKMYLVIFFLFFSKCSSLIQSNAGLTEFPDVPATDIQIFLGGNLITFIPDDKVSHLDCLARLHVDDNRLTSVPDLRPLASCLQELNLRKNRFVNSACYVIYKLNIRLA